MKLLFKCLLWIQYLTSEQSILISAKGSFPALLWREAGLDNPSKALPESDAFLGTRAKEEGASAVRSVAVGYHDYRPKGIEHSVNSLPVAQLKMCGLTFQRAKITITHLGFSMALFFVLQSSS